MKCMNCEANIPPEWQAAIANNSCPACGGSIMTDQIKVISDNLRIVVDDLISLGEEHMDLLLDTFGLQRKGVPNPSKEDNIPINLKIANNPVQEFLSRTNAPHLAKRNEKIKDILNRVNSAESEDVVIDMESIDDSNEEIPQTPALTAKQILENNSITSGDGIPPTMEEAEALNQLFDDGQEMEPDLHPALQKDRMKRLVQSRNVARGAGNGPFRRGG